MIRNMVDVSPFPGMDPWLEDSWSDVHTSLVTYARDQLQSQLGNGLVARLESRVYVESDFEEPKQYVPDVHVYGEVRRAPRRSSKGGTALLEPQLIPFSRLDVREAFIEIRDLKARERLITIVEFVSPVNKRGKSGRSAYLRKQRHSVRAMVNLVEIDLLRGGRPVTLAQTRLDSKKVSAAPYHVSIWREAKDQSIEYFPLSLRSALPHIGIPLRENDDDAALDLQALVEQTFRNGRYAEVIDYSKPPYPPLKGADVAWSKKLIAHWRKRSA
jgi:hypothetical protein